jgi:cell division protein FtsL
MKRPVAVKVSPVVWTAVGFGLLSALLVAHAAGRIGVIDEGLVLGKLQTEEQSLSRENARLRLELLTLRSPARLEKLNHDKLGLVPPSAGEVLHEHGVGPARAPVSPGAALAERP